MANDLDDFDGIDISGPWGGVRFRPGMRRGWEEYDSDGDAEYRRIRRKVRARLDFFKNAVLFVFIVGGLALIDWVWGDNWWVQWVAVIWGALLALQFFSTFVSPNIWGKDVEERMVRREMRRGRGSATIISDDEPAPSPS